MTPLWNDNPEDGLFPFRITRDDVAPSIVDCAPLLHRPAGRFGHVTARDGHLHTRNGRLRLFGVNLTTGACFPERSEVERVARRLARMGVNAVRFHHMDASWANDLLMAEDRETLHPDKLDRLDWFIAQLIDQGVYINLNLHVSREYPQGVRWEGMPDFFKGVDLFVPELLASQRSCARQLLTHRNPYTGRRYVEEPALALVEINNENGLLFWWAARTLDGMPDAYARVLTERWNRWLTSRYATPQVREQAWSAADVPLGSGMLQGERYQSGGQGWGLEQQGAARATARSMDAQTTQIDVEAVDEVAWHVQYHAVGLRCTGGQPLTVQFRARADAPRTVDVLLVRHAAPWTVHAAETVALTPEWRTYRLVLTPMADEDQLRLTFGRLGAQTGSVWFADMSLRPGAQYARPESNEAGVQWVPRAGFGQMAPPVQDDWLTFLADVERGYWTSMHRFIREELGCRSLVLGTAAPFSPPDVQAALDVVDAHAYWQHPEFPGRPWDPENWSVPNVSMAGDPSGGTLPGLAVSRVYGKPFVVTEYNHPSPNTYNAETLPLLTSMALLQDWDGFFLFEWQGGYGNWDSGRIGGFFSMEHHPAQLALMPACARLLHQRHMQPARRRRTLAMKPLSLTRLLARSGWLSVQSLGVSGLEPFVSAWGYDPRRDAPVHPVRPSDTALRSDTGEMTWDMGGKRMLLVTPSTRMAVGQTDGSPVQLGSVTVTVTASKQSWAAVAVTACDGKPVETSGRVLLTAAGMGWNSGMRWTNPQRNSVGANWGSAPALTEGIGLVVRWPAGGAQPRVWALDSRGARLREVTVARNAGGWQFTVDASFQTVWYELERPA